MVYQLRLTNEALEDLSRLTKTNAQRVADRLKWLHSNLDGITLQPLKGSLKGCYKLRIGDYRAIYSIDRSSATVTVNAVAHRSEAYHQK